MTHAERRAALEAIAAEVRDCTRCRLHEGRTRAVPGEGNADTEVVFVGEGPGFNEDRLGRPFVGRAGDLLVRLLASIGWRREDVFITNIVKCRPPDNRDPEPDEIAACAPYLQRQLQVLDPALVVTLGRHSMGRFMPGARISQAHGTVRPADPATGATGALVYALYHPAAALRSSDIERASFADVAGIPAALLEARRSREHTVAAARTGVSTSAAGATMTSASTSATEADATTIATTAVAAAANEAPLAEGSASIAPAGATVAPTAAGDVVRVATLADPPPDGAGDDQLTLF